jgi:hypothetical protein
LPVEELFGLLPPNSEDNHPYLENSDEFSFQELLLLHLPIDQIPSNRDICNQRLTIIYGITPERDLARLEIDQMILDICRLWQKRLSADISDRTREIKIRSRKRDSNLKEFDLRRDSTKELDTVDRFRKQSYYDQVLICGYCAESFIESLASFVKCNTRSFPIAESLDILCGMFHECRDINALMTFSIEVFFKF